MSKTEKKVEAQATKPLTAQAGELFERFREAIWRGFAIVSWEMGLNWEYTYSRQDVYKIGRMHRACIAELQDQIRQLRGGVNG